MESKARVLDVHKDFRTGKFQMVLEVDSINPAEDFKGEKRVILKPWREKRSLDANAYMWMLLHGIAVELGSTKEEVYEVMIQRYGIMARDDSGFITVTLRADIDKGLLPGHWKLYKETPEWNVYRLIRGTSEYDTKEMSWFLDRVIEEAKDLGVETMTPDELERLKNYEYAND